MTPNEFIAKWHGGGKERAEAQSFFNDLCTLVGHKTPREADPTRTWFAFEYGAEKTVGGKGFADAWKKGFFGWEAKGTKRSLQDAYVQLKMYSDDLQNPPLLVVCDLETFEIHTNFTNTVKEVHRFTVEDLAKPEILRKVRAMFHNPEELRPGTQRSDITADAAEKFAELAWALRGRGEAPQAVAHFLNRLVFCMFAEDIGLLTDNLFTRMVEGSQDDPEAFQANAKQLFQAMHKGGQAGFRPVAWFNGGLFDDDSTLRLTREELRTLMAACNLKWDQIEPSIFGTLFERGLDPSKRAQLGAHYTDPVTIMKLIRPVLVEPWLVAWEEEKAALTPLMAKADIHGSRKGENAAQKGARTKAFDQAQERFTHFLVRLRGFRVLDPACGSGNFLFMSLRALKDVEQRVMIEAEELGLERQILGVSPRQVLGIELNEYAAELARITVWIGEIQWMIQNGYGARENPILQPLDQIQCRDALLNADGKEASWPEADAIVGNPPFIGDKKMKGELGVDYTERVRRVYSGRVPGGANFVCYWFEKANDAIRAGTAQRTGLVATNSIGSGANQEVLKHIVDASRIYNAWSNEKWWDKGAAVRVALICFGNSLQEGAVLNGQSVTSIYSDLRGDNGQGSDLTNAQKLAENLGIAYLGIQKTGAFEIPGATAREWLKDPNPNGLSNGEVVRPWFNGEDLTDRPRDYWIIDYGTSTPVAQASLYEKPFAHAKEHVQPHRVGKREDRTNENWWIFQWPRPLMRRAITGMARYLATPETPTYTVFAWVPATVVPDKNLIIFARDDDTTFGILSSTIHLRWVRAIGSPYGNHPTARRYNSSRVFETFPFPEGLTPKISASQYAENQHAKDIAATAQALQDARNQWLNPAPWVDWVRTQEEEVAGFPLRPVAKSGHEAELKQRTLTNLYNMAPEWLVHLQANLDKAVAAAYGWAWPLTEDEILERLLGLNAARQGKGA